MKKLHLSLLLTLAVLTASSQKVYFIYIQAESEQPFFVKMNEKVSSSTGSGYIILAKLVDSTYNFSIGFPQNKFPEQNFSIAVNKRDHGYLLKNFGDKGWGIFDLQTMAVQMSNAGKASAAVTPVVDNKDVSPFTEILAKAADDPTLREKPVVVPQVEEKKVEVIAKAEPKKEEAPAVIKEQPAVTPAVITEVAVEKKEEPKSEIKETVTTKPVETPVVAAVNKEEIKAEAKETVSTKPVEQMVVTNEKKTESAPEVKETVVLVEKPAEIKTETITEVNTEVPVPYKASQVKKWAESSTTEGFGLVFIDGYENGTKDTIRLVIPNPNPVVVLAKEEPKEDKQFIKTNELPGNTTVQEESKKDTIVQASRPDGIEGAVVKKQANETAYDPTALTKSIVKTSCKDVATGDDFIKLRKRMAAVTTDDEMIEEAKKFYKLKCFTTWQLKNLGVLFLTDEGKYKFFDASYPYVTDPLVFAGLQSELKDEYYAGRFKAMLRN